ncbi:MAG: OmpA family protein [Gammaproteobacteria bacterium]|nr:OmpA family protein [Gammaproteobacteria bacterium]
MNARHSHQTLFHTCTAVALPLVLMIGCSEREPVAVERGAIDTATNRIVLEPDFDGDIAADSKGLRYIKVMTGTPAVQTTPKETPAATATSPVVYFDTDKDTVALEDEPKLKSQAGFLLAHPRYVLHVNGHADERGTEIHNADLSARRAQQVAALLRSFGVPETQLTVASFGARVPASDPQRWNENRRVELLYADDYVLSAR